MKLARCAGTGFRATLRRFLLLCLAQGMKVVSKVNLLRCLTMMMMTQKIGMDSRPSSLVLYVRIWKWDTCDF